MKNAFNILLFLLVSAMSSMSQNFGNEWINYDWEYYKFPVYQSGIHKISYNNLLTAGFPVNTIDPRRIRIYGFGQEQFIHIQGEADGVFNPDDYIEFYGEPNNGKADSVWYNNNPNLQATPQLSLFNDTIYYFLTYSNSISGNKRYQIETDVAINNYNASPYYLSIIERSFKTGYNIGQFYTGNIQDPRYTNGEGYGQIYQGNGSLVQGWTGLMANLKTTMYTAGPPASIDVWIAGASNPQNANFYDHFYQVKFGGSTFDTSTVAFQFTKLNYTRSASSVANATNAYEVIFSTAYAAETRNALTYIKTTLPQVYNLSGRTEHTLFIPNNSAQSKFSINITNFNALNTSARFYDLSNGRRMNLIQSGNNVDLVLPNGAVNLKKCYLSSDSAMIPVSGIKKIQNPIGGNTGKFRNFLTQYKDFDYIVITHKQFWNQGVYYASYRNLTGHNSICIDIDELYDQFAQGVPKNPNSIHQFLKFATSKWAIKPEHVFLIGKGYNWGFARFNPAFYSINLIPAVGNPPTDNLYVYNFNGAQNQNHIAIGRLSAETEADVNLYLQKVMQNESNQPALWMKRALHFGGGFSLAEQNVLASYLNNFKSIYEDTLFGGKVNTFLKSSNAPLLNTVSDSIKALINSGVSLMTFFGHASGSGFDTNIEEPSEYNNTGKYPLIIANSCYSGDLFQNYRSISERFVLEPQKGSIGFISSISAGLAPYLAYYSTEWYNGISWRRYNKSIGYAMRDASKKSYDINNIYATITGLEMSLHGDPAVKLLTQEKPDLVITPPQIFFNPSTVSTDIDSFEVKAVIYNQGRSFNGPFTVELKRKFARPGKADEFFTKQMNPVLFSDTVTFKLATDPVNGPGLNVITVTVDAFDVVDEITNINNQASRNLIIGTAEIIPVYPHNYAVIPNNSTWLKASTGNPFAPLRTYKIELDTTDTFNSPFKKDTVITQIGGVVKWKPSITFTPDSLVLFWRAGIDSAGTGTFHKWRESSFQYIQGKYGWGQDHFFQFKNNDYVYIIHNRPTRTFDFSPNLKQLKCVNNGLPQNSNDLNNIFYEIDGVLNEYGACGNPVSLHVAVIDPVTLESWGTRFGTENPNHVFGNANDNGACRSRVEKYFIFRTQDNNSRNSLKNMLNDSIPNGHYVLMYTMREAQFQAFLPDQLAAITALGADSVTALAAFASNRPWIFFVRKGYPDTKVEVVGPTTNSTISLTAVLQNEWTFGTMKSSLIGPAAKWNSFHWNQFPLENPTEDSVSVDIIGVTNSGTEVPIITGIQPSTFEILNLHNQIDATVYPFLKLREFTRDDTIRTPAQMNRWHILYDGVPEIALNPSLGYLFQSDTLPQGNTLKLATTVENIGDFPVDSVSMKYFIITQSNQQTNYYKKLKPLNANEFVTDTFSISNLNFPNLNSLWVETNHFDFGHQTEQYHFNNIGEKIFYTDVDKINPVLDVTFDGMRIMNDEIVSGKPEILIKLKDENKYRLLNDTANFELYLKRPSDTQPKRQNFGQTEINFIPANDMKNTCKIEFKPDLTQADGKYELRIRAKDASNNQSGKGDNYYDYNIRFQVINRSTITEVLNYPNPFSTSTRFVFTLTGSELPTFMKIQILTIDGTIVKEIFQNELGPIRIGRNITEYAWNGTDEFGDKLASGVYLYRVITNINGEEIEKRSTQADKYFKKGWGKMYLMR